MYVIAQKIEKNGHYCSNIENSVLIKYSYQAGRHLQSMKGEDEKVFLGGKKNEYKEIIKKSDR